MLPSPVKMASVTLGPLNVSEKAAILSQWIVHSVFLSAPISARSHVAVPMATSGMFCRMQRRIEDANSLGTPGSTMPLATMTTIFVLPDVVIFGMTSEKRRGAGIASPRLHVSETPDLLAKAQRNLCLPKMAFAFSNGARKEERLRSEKPGNRRIAIAAVSSASAEMISPGVIARSAE
ncbi:hypothetical protein [Ensifer aridi]|uniref:hypothetical protein n=1 Tax=Ensifer aridi TaxID=1708715 RepID=UPI0030B823A1